MSRKPDTAHAAQAKKGDALAPQVEMVEAASLRAYARNSRTHDESQIDELKASITEFGFTNPLLIDADNEIIAGHGRLAAATALGLKHVPCIRLGHLTPKQKRAYVIADNKLAMNAGWDWAVLREELAAIQADGTGIGITGFTEDEMLALQGGQQDWDSAFDEDHEYVQNAGMDKVIECPHCHKGFDPSKAKVRRQ